MSENAEFEKKNSLSWRASENGTLTTFVKNVNHLPGLHFLFEENVDVDITEISAHQDKLLP